MSSILTHPVPILALGVAGVRIPPRLFIAAIFFTWVPDFDAIGFHLGIAYGSWFGHRGFSHSLFFALLCALFGMGIAPWLRASRLLSGALIFLAVTSHIVLDALTNGGLGVAAFWPFSETRHFFAWRPIQVSPMSLKLFFTTERGLHVMASELRWVWLPFMLGAIAWRFMIGARR